TVVLAIGAGDLYRFVRQRNFAAAHGRADPVLPDGALERYADLALALLGGHRTGARRRVAGDRDADHDAACRTPQVPGGRHGIFGGRTLRAAGAADLRRGAQAEGARGGVGDELGERAAARDRRAARDGELANDAR